MRMCAFLLLTKFKITPCFLGGREGARLKKLMDIIRELESIFHVLESCVYVAEE